MAAVLPFPRAGIQYSPPIPLDIATVEQAILAQLATAFGGAIVGGKITGALVDIDHYPERAAESYRLTHRIGAVLVRFDGSEYSPVIDTEEVIQERTFRWFVAILTRDLGWSYGGQASGPSPGAYQLIETVRLALSGFRVTGFRKMYPVSEEHEGKDKEGGVYYYNAIYRHVTMALEQDTEPNHPILVKAQAFEEGGQTTINVPIAPFTFSGPAPGAIQLPQINLSNVVVFKNDMSIEYSATTDYVADPVAGTVTRVAGGNIGANATVQIGFSYADSVTSIASGGAAPEQPSN
jgi:Gp37 protein